MACLVVGGAASLVVITAQVTPHIEGLFRAAAWWDDYDAAPAPMRSSYYTLLLVRRPLCVGYNRMQFANSTQGRDLLTAELQLGGGIKMLAATSHLESFVGATADGSAERKWQLDVALEVLSRSECADVLFAGDTNWNDDTGGDMSAMLPPGWHDAWLHLRPGEPGFTYDAVANAMLMVRACHTRAYVRACGCARGLTLCHCSARNVGPLAVAVRQSAVQTARLRAV
jgi:hypothetical protein